MLIDHIQRFWLRLVSGLILILIPLQDLAFAASVVASVPTPISVSFRLPASVGFVEDSFSAPGAEEAPLIVLIQDAHANVSGQQNVARALELILPAENIRTVFLEASDGDVSLSFLKKSANSQKRREIAARYLKSGWLQGSEFANIVSEHSFELWGVEDPALYDEGLRLYAEIAKNRADTGKILAKIESTVRAIKPQIYNAALAAFDQKRAAHADGNMPFVEYAEFLVGEAERMGVAAPLGRLNALKQLKSDEAQIDFSKAGEEQRLALASLVGAEAEELRQIARDAARFAPDAAEKNAAFFAALEESLSARGERAHEKFSELIKYFAYLKKAQQLEPKRMLEEVEQAEALVFAALTRTEDERGLRRVEQNTGILAKLVDLSLTPQDFDRYRREGRFFDTTYLTGFLNRRIAELGSDYDKALFLDRSFPETVRMAEAFYDLTLARDRTFVDRALAKMRAGAEKKAALITGGYHAPNLKRLFREKGISYVSVTPNVLHETDRARYEKLLLDDAGVPAADADAQNLMVRHLIEKAKRQIAVGGTLDTTRLGRFVSDFGVLPTGARVRTLEELLNGDDDGDEDTSTGRRATRWQRLTSLNVQEAPYRFRDLDILNDVGADMVFSWNPAAKQAFAATGLKAEKLFPGSLPQGRSEDYHQGLLRAAEIAAGAGDEARSEMFFALRIAHKIISRFANNANLLSDEQNQWHERAFQFADAAMKIDSNNATLLKDYGFALIQTRRFAEAEKFFESIKDRNVPGGLVAFAAYKRRIAAERLVVYRESLEQKRFEEALVLSQAAFQDMSDATNILIGVTSGRQHRSGSEAAAAFAELAEIDRLRAEYDVQSLSNGIEMKGRDFVLSALRHMESALRNVNRALAADTHNRESKALDSATGLTLGRTARVLRQAAGRRIDSSKVSQYEAIFDKIEDGLTQNQFGFGRPAHPIAKTIRALVAETRERFEKIDELRHQVIEGMQIVAQQNFEDPDAADLYFSAVETYLVSLYEKRPQPALDVLNDIRERMQESVKLDALDVAVIGASSKTLDITALAAAAQKRVFSAAPAEILGRWKAGRYDAIALKLTGIVTPKRREPAAETGYKRDPKPYSNATIAAAVSADPTRYEAAEAIHRILTTWPVEPERERRAMLMASLRENLKEQIDKFVAAANPLLSGGSVRQRLRDDLKEMREGRDVLSKEELEAKLGSSRDEELPYLPRLLYFMQLVDEEETRVIRRIESAADEVAAYRSRAASFASLFGFKLLDAHVKRLEALENEIRRIGTKNGDLSVYLWFERFEALVEQARSIFEELDSLAFHAKVFGETKRELNRLAESVGASPPVLSDAVTAELREAYERLSARFANVPFERSARSVQRRAREIAAEARELSVRAEAAAAVVRSFAPIRDEFLTVLEQFDDHRGAFEPGTNLVADADEPALERKLADWVVKHDLWNAGRVTLDNHIEEAAAWEKEKKNLVRDLAALRAQTDAVRARKMLAIRGELQSMRRMLEWFRDKVKENLYYHEERAAVPGINYPRAVEKLEATFAKWLSVWTQLDQKLAEFQRTPKASQDLPSITRRSANINNELLSEFLAFTENEIGYSAAQIIVTVMQAVSQPESALGPIKPASMPVSNASVIVRGSFDRFGYPDDLRVMFFEGQVDRATATQAQAMQPATDDMNVWLRRAKSYLFRKDDAAEFKNFEGLGPLPAHDFLFALRMGLFYYVTMAESNDGEPLTPAASTLGILYSGEHTVEDLQALPTQKETAEKFKPMSMAGFRVLDDEFKAHAVRFIEGAAAKANPDRPVPAPLSDKAKKRIVEHILRVDRQSEEEETDEQASQREADKPAGSRYSAADAEQVYGFASGVTAAFGQVLFAGEARAETAFLIGAAPETAVVIGFERGEDGAEAKVIDLGGAELDAFKVERVALAAKPRMPESEAGADLKVEWKARAERRASFVGTAQAAQVVRPGVFWIDLEIFSDLKFDVAKDAEIFDAYVDIYASKFLTRPNGFVGLLNASKHTDLAARAEKRIALRTAKLGSGGFLSEGEAEPEGALRVGLLVSDSPAFERDGRSVSFFAERLESTSRGEARVFADAAAVADAMVGASLVVPAGKSVEDIQISDIPDGVVVSFNDAVGAEGRSGGLGAKEVREILVDPAAARRSPFSLWKLDWKQAFELLRFVRSEIDRAA